MYFKTIVEKVKKEAKCQTKLKIIDKTLNKIKIFLIKIKAFTFKTNLISTITINQWIQKLHPIKKYWKNSLSDYLSQKY
jgi:hypothetical protein